MKLKIIIILVIAFNTISCNKSQANNEILLKGKIGKYESLIYLNKTEDKYDGYFSYVNKNEKIKVKGMMVANNLILNEYNNDEKNSITGVFNGTFDGTIYKGIWTGPSNEEKVSFSFQIIEKEKAEISKTNQLKNDVEYIWKVGEDLDPYTLNLTARLNNKTYKILDNVQQFEVEEIDFNENGYTDLITIENCGTGNGCPYNVLYYIHYNEDKDEFIVSEAFGLTDDAEFEMWYGKNSIIMTSYKAGEMYQARERYTFLNNLPERVEYNETYRIQALEEIYEVRTLEYKDEYKLFFDINDDGEIDEITCGYWLKYDIYVDCSVILNGKSIRMDGSGKRVGILPTKTNGYNDLVFHLNDVYSWNGEKYIKK